MKKLCAHSGQYGYRGDDHSANPSGLGTSGGTLIRQAVRRWLLACIALFCPGLRA
jgi:hypothetical protein